MIRSFVIQGQAHDLYQEAFASSRGGQERSLTTRPSQILCAILAPDYRTFDW